jgi:hypothetical protein
MLFSVFGVEAPEGTVDAWDLSSFSVIVDVEGEREKLLAIGPRWVSFSSGHRRRQ